MRKLVPVDVSDCAPDELLSSVVYVDVVGLPETTARTALLDAVADTRPKPSVAPSFPESGGEGRASGCGSPTRE